MQGYGTKRCVVFALLVGAALAGGPITASAQISGYVVPVYSFTDGADGGEPIGGVIADTAGNLYGEASIGGAAVCTLRNGSPKAGCGTVYRFSNTTGLTTLVSFAGANGAYGNNPLTLVGSTLYGMTTQGGVKNDGIIFSVRTDGTGFTLLHQFSGADGSLPAGTLRIGAGNVVYGITKYGGNYNAGVLFSIEPDGTYTILHEFADSATDGGYPLTLSITQGVLVGSTLDGGGKSAYCEAPGCGELFEYVPATGTYTEPYAFGGSAIYGGYIGSIGPGPTVYGNGITALYGLSSAGVRTVALLDQNQQGDRASGPLLTPDGTLISVTGDNQFGPTGYLLSAQASATDGPFTTLALFGGGDGTDPTAQPILVNGQIIGTAPDDGKCSTCGVIWIYKANPIVSNRTN